LSKDQKKRQQGCSYHLHTLQFSVIAPGVIDAEVLLQTLKFAFPDVG
jgi:hypothetical protein